MYKPVEMYQTADGKYHTTEQQAERHATDLLCRKVEQFINSHFDISHRPSVIKAVNSIADDRALAIAQLKELLHILSYHE